MVCRSLVNLFVGVWITEWFMVLGSQFSVLSFLFLLVACCCLLLPARLDDASRSGGGAGCPRFQPNTIRLYILPLAPCSNALFIFFAHSPILLVAPSLFHLFASSPKRYGNNQCCSLSFTACNCDIATKRDGSFAYAYQCVRTRIFLLSFGNTNTIVFYT